MVAVAAVTSAFGVIQTWISTKVGQQVMHGLRTSVFAHLQRQSIAFFTRTRTGEVQSRITNDIGGMESVVTSTATSIAANLTTAIATAVAMVALSWRLSLISLVVMPPSIYLTRKVARMRRAITTQQQRELADLNVTIEEGLSINGVQLAKTMGTGPALVAAVHRLLGPPDRPGAALPAGRPLADGLHEHHLRRDPGDHLPRGRAADDRRPDDDRHPGRLHYIAERPLPAADRPAQHGRLGDQLAGAVRADLRVPRPARRGRRPRPPGDIDPARVPGHVRLDDVSFTYPGADRAALNGIDLDVPPGSTLALVGETGSGKTTLAALVARLYDPSQRSVRIDGIDLRDMRLADLAAIVGVVSQETYLLHTTVRENLRYAKPDATDTEIEDAARAAQIHDLIAGLPDGYDTVVGSRGYRFSGGEKQRIAIARTLLRDPRVLVLDEATSALDTETERAVQQAFDALARGRTTITIAHRLSTVRDADQIVVLDHGQVIESGTHASLIAATAATPPRRVGHESASTPAPVDRPRRWAPPSDPGLFGCGDVARRSRLAAWASLTNCRPPSRSRLGRIIHGSRRRRSFPASYRSRLCSWGGPSRPPWRSQGYRPSPQDSRSS